MAAKSSKARYILWDGVVYERVGSPDECGVRFPEGKQRTNISVKLKSARINAGRS
jgi:hypothetical protein